MKKVLVTGANSYVGDSFMAYAAAHYGAELSTESVDTVDGTWRERDLAAYDVVFHVAGIAHADVGGVSEETRARYYAVNTDLALEVAAKAKSSGVGQFVLMSSAIVYGDSAPYGRRKRITADTEPAPANFYGDSKWRADQGVRALADDAFTVTVLRPPMIYGKGSRGNYPVLASLAKRLPFFPDVKNERSMLYVENLCEFLCQAMIRGAGGIYWPQNPEYGRTSEVVRLIAKASGHRIRVSGAWNWAVALASRIPGKPSALANKAFGNLSYDQSLSRCGFDYQLYGLEESISRTESSSRESSGKRALQLASVASMIDQFNIPNIEILKSLGFSVDVVADFTDPGTITRKRADQLLERLAAMGVRVTDVPIPRELNPKRISDAYKLVSKSVREGHYDLIHCHSPIGGALCRVASRKVRRDGTKVIYTAHGFHFYDGAPLRNWLVYYPVERFLSRWTDVLVTINKEDYRRAKEHFHAGRTVYVPGVGVDTERFRPRRSGRERVRAELGVPLDGKLLISVGELSARKNHAVVVQALQTLPDDYWYAIVGKGELAEELLALDRTGRLRLLGYREDVRELLWASDLFVFPSLQEGLPVALMEAMAAGLPCVASDIRGNTDLLGRGVDPRDARAWTAAIVAGGTRGSVDAYATGIVQGRMRELYRGVS